VGSGAWSGTGRVKRVRQPRVNPAAAAMLAQRPNDTRVRGAGPARKTFIAPKACKAPHPLQPIVRPRPRAVAKLPARQLSCAWKEPAL
jgi:hypothetical protein